MSYGPAELVSLSLMVALAAAVFARVYQGRVLRTPGLRAMHGQRGAVALRERGEVTGCAGCIHARTCAYARPSMFAERLTTPSPGS